eukprot:scaffold74187_cov13-Tisochrysis_lutea.AAC.2
MPRIEISYERASMNCAHHQRSNTPMLQQLYHTQATLFEQGTVPSSHLLVMLVSVWAALMMSSASASTCFTPSGNDGGIASSKRREERSADGRSSAAASV